MQSVLITGANRSIGLETARQLSKKELFVYLGSRDLEKGRSAVDDLIRNGFENVKPVEIDVTKPETLSAARSLIEDERGKLDILISNAGVLGPPVQHAVDTPIEDIRHILDTNLFGNINATRAFLNLLKLSESPRISLITSGLASLTLHSDPSWRFYDVKQVGYMASKAALNAYTVTLAYELKDLPFKVNAIDPGFTATDFNNHIGTGTVESAAAFIIKHTLTGNDAPTGQFFSNDIADTSGISPW
ncbi:SDR family NAD(P)-dependent oxidoreductase (plasmid) [Agrobacterium tumefaciens]|uniref:SDR family NAD(P)-dependent oxidoreductase n=1 Tax=Agrobacterium tumefaciens TaxID=358 RepID=A0AAJ4TD71_AGRTU|nr:SDR family NAD(P)-dependent oxidoreductase [Agrobacterium tumefaciens]